MTPPPQRTAYFSRARRPGVVLRVSRMRAPVPSTASTQRAVSGRDARQVAQQVEHRAFDGQQPPYRTFGGQHDVAGLHAIAVGSDDRHLCARALKHQRGDLEAGHHPGRPGAYVGDSLQVGGDRRGARHVDRGSARIACPEVLCQRPIDDVGDQRRVESSVVQRGHEVTGRYSVESAPSPVR